MLRSLFKSPRKPERRRVRSWGDELATPAGRRAAQLEFQLADHAFLRLFWTNLFEVAPGVWRSNQPSPRRLARYRRMGIRSVLNLRGEDDSAAWALERDAAERLGLDLIEIRLKPHRLVPRETFAELFAIFDRIERPFVMHCKSGADRAGLASALWLLDQEAASVAVARRQLHWRYIHLRNARTGILDYLLDAYEADCRREPMPVRQWFATRYDPDALSAAFRAGHPRVGRGVR